MKKIILQNLPLLLILIFAFLVRLYRFDGPVADWHSWRQADTSAVSRNFVQHGYDLLHPTYDDISNIQTGVDNPKGYRFVEFPLYNAAQALFSQYVGILTLEQWGRLITIFGSLFSIVFLYLLTKKYISRTVGLFTAFFYAFLPYNIYYGRVILPDPAMVCATLGGIYFFDIWISYTEKKQRKTLLEIAFFLLAFSFTSGAFLFKPYAGFFLLPMVYIAYKTYGFFFWKKWQLWVFALLAVAPFIAWRLWILQFPEGVPANSWLLNGNGIRFRPSFFRWIFYERITKLISGYFGIIFLGFGIYRTIYIKNAGFVWSFIGASLLYLSVFATGNVQHDYYQILIMPTTALLFGIGCSFLLQQQRVNKLVAVFICIFLTVATFYFSWQQVKDYFNINNQAIVRAGQVVDRLTPKDAKVIAPYEGDTSFLYQTKRKGWPSFQNDLQVMIEKLGANYLIIVNPKPQDFDLDKKYKLVSKTQEYILVDLQKRP